MNKKPNHSKLWGFLSVEVSLLKPQQAAEYALTSTNQISDRNILDKFCTDFCSITKNYAKYIIVSGFLVIASGRMRATEDIDMIIERIPKNVFLKLHAALMKKGFACMQTDNPETMYDEYLVNNLKSDKDLEDAKHLRKVYAEQINENEIVRIKQQIKRLRL